jgi:hypothetical protein
MKSQSSPILGFIRQFIFDGLESFGRYYSTYRGIVADNEDPLHANRLQLIIPEVGGADVFDYWAFPKGCFSGKDYGMQVLPLKGDVVWVEFERGNPEVPIWHHGHYGQDEKPQTGDYADTKSYWFKTPGGITVMANDTKNYVLIDLPGSKQQILINKDEAQLVHDKKIKLGGKDAALQPAIKGDDHNNQEAKLLQALRKLTVSTAMGPSSVPINSAEFQLLENELKSILSKKVDLE